jgi:ribose transport system substrate-binding protein
MVNSKLLRSLLLVGMFLLICIFASAQSPYAAYEMFRKSAESLKPYPGQPGKGKTLGFANIMGTATFCQDVEKSIVEQAKLAGFAAKDIYILDNRYDAVVGLKNADVMLAKHPDVFVEFQIDASVNNIVAQKFGKAGIPVIAVDGPVPGAPFMGVNNWQAGVVGGEWAVNYIKKKWGSLDKVDLVIIGELLIAGETPKMRTHSFAYTIAQAFGIADWQKDPKFVRMDTGHDTTEEAKEAMTNLLPRYPNAKIIVMITQNDETMAGAISAMEMAGRWNADNTLVVAHGCDALGQDLVRQGKIDGDIAYFPEHYGWYIVPAVAAILQGKPVPSHMFVDNAVITKENIDKYYPKK